MADLSKIVCLEQDCRHGTEQAVGSGSGNDTYTKAEIDSKDADIRAAASEAKSVANNAQSVNPGFWSWCLTCAAIPAPFLVCWTIRRSVCPRKPDSTAIWPCMELAAP